MLKFGAGVIVGAMLAAASGAAAYVVATVDMSGVLEGYVVQKDGKTVCRDPSVWNQFRSPESYIVCD